MLLLVSWAGFGGSGRWRARMEQQRCGAVWGVQEKQGGSQASGLGKEKEGRDGQGERN